MTSIEWLIKELEEQKLIKLDKLSTILFNKNFATRYELIVEEAKRMHNKEMATNCSQHHISNIDYWEKTLKYWKDEKEFAIVGSFYYGNCCARIGILEDIFKCIQPIQKLPQQEISDEEIEKAVNEYADAYQCPSQITMCKHDIVSAWNNAIKWYREQLKQKL